MPNFKTHFIVGGLAALGILCIARKTRDEPISLAEAAVAFFGGGTVASFPDIIDVPTSPNHRSVAHSVATTAIISTALTKLPNNTDISNNQKDMIYALGGAYLSHIALDATTPAGLPLLSN